MSTTRFALSDLTRIAVFAAIIAVLGLPGTIRLAGDVPITAQTLGVMLAGAVLGAWRGAAAVTLFLGLVALGLPLLAGGRGGIVVFFGESGGFLLGWIAGAFVIGLIVHARKKLHVATTALGIATGGIVVVYIFGTVVGSLVTRLPYDAYVLKSLIFVPGDLIKVVLATLIVTTLARAYPRAFRRTQVEQSPSAPQPDATPSLERAR